MPAQSLMAELRERARNLGAGEIAALPLKSFARWVDECAERARLGFDCSDWADLQADPLLLLPSARSIIVGYLVYEMDGPPGAETLFGWIHPAYHVWAPSRRIAKTLASALEEKGFRTVANPALPEKAAIASSSLTKYRRNGTVGLEDSATAILPFTLITEAELQTGDEAPDMAAGLSLADSCTSCSSCLATCRTSALQSTARVDPAFCVTFYNEQEDWIPTPIRSAMANRLVGCERCQLGCFRDKKLSRPEDSLLYLPDIVKEDKDRFIHRNKSIYKKYGVGWKTREGLIRAAIIGLGCSGRKDVAVILAELLADSSPIIRGHAAWAIGNLGAREFRDDLQRLFSQEADELVVKELKDALRKIS